MDDAMESKIGFSLLNSLNKATKQKLFSGFSIHATAGVQPPPDQMKGESVQRAATFPISKSFLSNFPSSSLAKLIT